MGCDIDRQWAAVQRFSSGRAGLWLAHAARPCLLLAAAAAATAQPSSGPPPPPPWNPGAPTTSPRARTSRAIAPGIWRRRGARSQVKAFNAYLATYQGRRDPADLAAVPHRDLVAELRRRSRSKSRRPANGRTSSRRCAMSTIMWSRRSARSKPVSVYRNPALNPAPAERPESAHKHYSAIDMVPLRPTTREELMQALCAIHARRGPDYQVGLGFYAFLRFHVDTTKFRRWNMDPAVAAQCPPIVHPEDIADVASRCRHPQRRRRR